MAVALLPVAILAAQMLGRFALLWIVLAAVLATAAWDAGAAAQPRSRAAPWCAWNPGLGNLECRFYTHEPCMATAWGLGGLCVQNPRYGDADAVRYRRQAR